MPLLLCSSCHSHATVRFALLEAEALHRACGRRGGQLLGPVLAHPPLHIQVHDLIFIRDNARKGFVKVRLENSLKPPRPPCGRKSALRNSLKPRASHHLRPGRSHTRKATHDTYTCTYPATSARVLAAAHTPRLKQATHRYAACPWHPWRALGFGAGCVRIRR